MISKYLNIKDDNNDTILMKAIFHNNLPMVKILLDLGCNIDYRGDRKMAALLYACRHNMEMVELLLKNGCKPDIQDINEKMALLYTMYNIDIDELLLETRCDIIKRYIYIEFPSV